MGTLATQTMSFNAEWTCAELSHAVCDALVAAEKPRVKPAFIRADREVKITGVFESAGLDGAKMTTCNARGVEVAVRNATEGEAWVDDVQGALRDMLSEDAQNSTEGPGESEELKAVKAALREKAKEENPDGEMPVMADAPVEVPVKTASTAVNQATKPWTAPNQDRKEEEVAEAAAVMKKTMAHLADALVEVDSAVTLIATTAARKATCRANVPNQDRIAAAVVVVEEAKSATTVARWVTFPVNALMVLLVVAKVAETTARVVVEAGKQLPQDGHLRMVTNLGLETTDQEKGF